MSDKRALVLVSLGTVALAVATFFGLPYEFGRFLGAN